MRKEIYIPILGLIIGELTIFRADILYGLAIHIINLIAIIFIIIFSNITIKEKNILQSLTLPIILRIIGFSVPFRGDIVQPLVYGIIIVPVYLTIKYQNISIKDLGINFSNIYIYIIPSIIIGIATALYEYRLKTPLINLRISDLVFITILILIFTGIFIALIEEFIFRSIIQTRFVQTFGFRNGLLLTGILFGIMHSGYGIFNGIISATIFGIILGYIFQKLGNIFCTGSIHGIFNMLFGTSLMSITTKVSPNIISISEEYVAIFLIIILSMCLLVQETRYGNEYISNTLKIYYLPLLLVFSVVIFYTITI